ncbi:glycosyltransferase family 4 protein [Microbacterium yannicii]|uniref:glycosyltransferase family 4 protein n=1 Tax=Microbacterium yannicii TaxID=671622 RepID=UPI0002EA03E8|nr:glycosyltransferase family 4 protein [Microbacterium yannicii]
MTAPDSTVWFVVPEGFDDPQRVSGGNVYDQRVSGELRSLGWDVHVLPTSVGSSRRPDPLEAAPDGDLVLVDGLIATRAPSSIEAAAGRLRIIVLAHMAAGAFDDSDPHAIDGERRALARAHRVIATSEWLRGELARHELARPERIVVATPGSDEAPPAAGSSTGGSLLCVGVVASHKGQDTLVEALADLSTNPTWTCTFAGSVTTDRAFAERTAADATAAGLSRRINWTGVLDARELGQAYSAADVLVAPSRTESYGIAVADALSRGIPVIASDVGGIPEAAQPPEAVMLVPPQDGEALASALREWLEDPARRAEMSAAARRAAPSRRRWSDTARDIHSALAGLR